MTTEASTANNDNIFAEARRRMFVVFDLDGTLALTGHREHFLKREKKDWRGFYAACDKDEPCHQIIRVLQALHLTGAHVEIWTGRSGEVAEKTSDWLAAHGMGHVPVKMRDEGDHRPDTVLKQEWLNNCDIKPKLVFEDRASVVAMWRSNGIVCCQVAPGDF
jgi:phosphoglycolate phosphatase-like HAD superfamily hydrolase